MYEREHGGCMSGCLSPDTPTLLQGSVIYYLFVCLMCCMMLPQRSPKTLPLTTATATSLESARPRHCSPFWGGCLRRNHPHLLPGGPSRRPRRCEARLRRRQRRERSPRLCRDGPGGGVVRGWVGEGVGW